MVLLKHHGSRSANVRLYNTRFSAARNQYDNAARLNSNFKSFFSSSIGLGNCLHSDYSKLMKRLFKRQIHKLLLTELGIEDDYVYVHALVLKVNTHNYCIL